MERIIGQIIRNKLPCYFISPHLDDAALSAGGLMTYLASKSPVKIITIFTEGTTEPYTLVMRRFLKKCGYRNALELFQSRRKEDMAVLKHFDLEPQQLGFIDGGFRKKTVNLPFFVKKILPELTHQYPLGRVVFGLSQENLLRKQIEKRLMEIIPNNENHVIFCPLGSVQHMDHQITHEISTALFGSQHLIFWRDYPYITDPNYTNAFITKNYLQSFTWDKNLEEKKRLIEGYESQIHAMFPNEKVPLIPDVYYISEK